MTQNRFPNDLDHWRSELLTSQVRTQPNVLPPLQQQQQQIVASKQRKKKSPGSRADQYFRRRLNRRKLDDETKALLLQTRLEGKQQQQQIVHEKTMEINPIDDQTINMPDDEPIMEFHDDFDADDETNIQFDKRHRQFVKEYDDDLFDIEQCPKVDQILLGLTVGEQGKQQYLSGKLSHLSATHQESESTTRAADVLSRIKTDNVVISSQFLPKYLSHESKEFDRMILGLRQQTGTIIYTEELRAIAFLIDQL
ncbi:unnamed protein product, partial [Rotaria sordida]